MIDTIIISIFYLNSACLTTCFQISSVLTWPDYHLFFTKLNAIRSPSSISSVLSLTRLLFHDELSFTIGDAVTLLDVFLDSR
jgi:hypothetical protein